MVAAITRPARRLIHGLRLERHYRREEVVDSYASFDLERLGDHQFELMCQSLLKAVVGPGTTTFGEGPDGGREATYIGKAPYPSQAEQWDGYWIFQVKFHNTQLIGHDKARAQVLADLRSELSKIVLKIQRPCDNYILITNVALTSVHKRGTHDQITDRVAPESAPH